MTKMTQDFRQNRRIPPSTSRIPEAELTGKGRLDNEKSVREIQVEVVNLTQLANAARYGQQVSLYLESKTVFVAINGRQLGEIQPSRVARVRNIIWSKSLLSASISKKKETGGIVGRLWIRIKFVA